MRFFLAAVLCIILTSNSAFSDGVADDLIRQFKASDDEVQKSELVVQLNRAVTADSKCRAAVATLLRTELNTAESLELVSSLAHSWWMHEDKTKDLSAETKQLVFQLLDDVRSFENRRYSPTKPRERAIRILSSCTKSVVPDVIGLLDNSNPLHRAAGIEILAARGYFDSHFAELNPFVESTDINVQLAVAKALNQNKNHRDESVTLCFRMMNTIKNAKVDEQLALAAAAHAEHLGKEKAWKIQQQLLEQRTLAVDRAIAITMTSLGPEEQRATVDKIVGAIHFSRWIRHAVLTAGENGKKALPYFLKRFEEAEDKNRLQRAVELYRIERDANRVIMLFLNGLDSTSSTQRYYAFSGIRHIGPEAEVAVPKLTQLLQKKSRTILHQSLVALAAIKTDSKETLQAVESILESTKDPYIETAARKTLNALTEPSE